MTADNPTPGTPRTLGNVIVTGGASGLGRAVARKVADGGGTPWILDVNPGEDGFEQETVDLADTRAAEESVRKIVERAGGLDAVVTAAAMDTPADFAETDRETWERIVTVNLFGTAAVVRAALPALSEAQGTVVTVASTLGLRALPAATAYAASKHGVVGFTRALAMEVGGKVGVTMLVPGGMATHFFDDRDEQFKPAPDQLLNDPAHVAEAVLFALRQPAGCEVRELLITPSVEPSWP
ncbi:SDR family oxidoreductase [Egicoccus halophilus]|uniref:Short-chain dehydrogenase n=1 Tax=Egicoccus halophilus TaxID=1670830 RepID=A0A8J3ADC7_9ACTN|nr:SDR family oxidoreductase [Egicoccus halophilus]GGI04567.1 short-chain dehydrogenase [Egicoccus halophilus]